ncbi:MAG TPA: Flp family type IVb pilin [Herpetosiphonaceae bacterium]
MLRNFFAREEGQGLVEYALILVLIAIVVIAILTLLGQQVSSVFETINGALTQ